MSRTAEMPSIPEGEIGYILKGYPRLSETFILNEIRLLESMGLSLHLFALKRARHHKNHAMVRDIQAAVTYLPEVTSLTESHFVHWLWVNLPKFFCSHVWLWRLRPQAYLQTLGAAISMSVRYRSRVSGWPKKVFLKEFLQAGVIALQVVQSGRVRHLHAHFAHGATTITMFASQLCGLPFSFTAHAKDIYQQKLNPGDLLPKKMRRAAFVVTCTAANKAHLTSLGLLGVTIHTVYHGLDTTFFTPSLREYEPDQVPVILAVGRLVEKKGFTYLVQACRYLKDQGYTFRCQIVGEAGEQTDTITQLIHSLQLADTVSLHPAVPHEELRNIYQHSTIFALPCQIVDDGDWDGIPNVLVEAMAMELPVVSTMVTGIPELIEPGVNGLLVPQKDATALAASLAMLLQYPALRQQLGKAAREKVCQLFEARRTTAALQTLFVSCLRQDVG